MYSAGSQKMTVSFATQAVSYLEDRADGGFAWNVAYDLSANGSAVNVELRIDLVGANPGATAEVWEKGAEAIWNEKVFFSDGKQLYAFTFDVDFVNSNAHHTVEVHAGAGRDDMANWYLQQPDWGQDFLDEIGAHEMGHMLGNFDEYAGGATFGGFTTTGTLMSDLSLVGFADYVFGIEFFAEQASGQTLSAVLADLGTAGTDTIRGGAGLDGIYGLAGNDRISGLGGADFINGGGGADVLAGGGGKDTLIGANGNDRMNGGGGSDLLDGGLGFDTFVFSAALGKSNIDTIASFDTANDTIELDNATFTGLRGTTLAASAFHIGASAADAGDRVIFNANSGALLFDADGRGGDAAIQFAVIETLTGSLSASDFAII